MANRWLILALKISVSGALLGLLARKVDLASAAMHLRHVQWTPLVAAALLFGVSLFLSAWRWRMASGNRLSMKTCLRFTWIGQLYGLVLPGALSADVAKGVVMSAEKKHGAGLPVSIMLDRVAGLGTLVVMGLVACAMEPGMLAVLSSDQAWVLAGLSCTGLLILPWICQWLRWPVISGIIWMRALLVSVVIHAVNVSFYGCCLLAVGLSKAWWVTATFTALLNFAMLLPVSIAGVGLRDQLAVHFLGGGVGGGAAQVAFSWIVLTVNVFHGLIGLALQAKKIGASKAE